MNEKQAKIVWALMQKSRELREHIERDLLPEDVADQIDSDSDSDRVLPNHGLQRAPLVQDLLELAGLAAQNFSDLEEDPNLSPEMRKKLLDSCLIINAVNMQRSWASMKKKRR